MTALARIPQNARGEAFLVEKWIPEVLNDAWACNGVQQAANLLYNLADAIAFVHSKGLVHGDIKPDNIGKEDDAFILLDFGISRPIPDFTKDTTATGSLRTRAPELLVSDGYAGDPTKVDIWAIGATLFNFLMNRFPLIDRNEQIPRISQPQERQAFEYELGRRVREEWDKRVTVETAGDPLLEIVARTLQRDPRQRPAARELMNLVENELPVFLRRESQQEVFAPIDELSQLQSYLPEPEVLALMPSDEKTRFRNRLAKLREIRGFTSQQLEAIESLEHILNA